MRAAPCGPTGPRPAGITRALAVGAALLCLAGCSLGPAGRPAAGGGASSEVAELRARLSELSAEASEASQRAARYRLADSSRPEDLARLGYLLEKQSRMAVRGAEEAWLSLGDYGGSPFDRGILDQLRAELAALATDTYADAIVEAVAQEFQGGEGGFAYPDREDVLELALVSRQGDRATVEEKLREHFPATDFGGGEFTSVVANRIELARTPEGWRLADVVNESQGSESEAAGTEQPPRASESR